MAFNAISWVYHIICSRYFIILQDIKQGFPLSSFVKRKNYKLGRNSLMLSLRAIEKTDATSGDEINKSEK